MIGSIARAAAACAEVAPAARLAAHFRRREIRPNLCPALATGGADEAILDVGEAHVVSPAVGIHRHAVAALVVGAVDQNAAHAHLAHLVIF
jgi:hypothetical protein